MIRKGRVFENHGEVLEFWRQQGVREATLVCLDQHLDLKKIGYSALTRIRDAAAKEDDLRVLHKDVPFRDDDRFAFGIDDFLYAAIALKIFRRIVWVLPEPRRMGLQTLARALWQALSLIPGHGHEALASFTVGERRARARVLDAMIEVTTLRRLPGLHIEGEVRLDVDLDFFAVFQSASLSFEVARVARTLLKSVPFSGPVSLSCSIASGHLAPALRYLGPALAAEMDLRLETADPPPDESPDLHRILGDAPLSCAEYREILEVADLGRYGGAGCALQALLALRIPDLEEAERSYYEARRLGDRANWAAYKIGLHHLAGGDYARAADWFRRTDGDLVDSLQASALCLAALCEYRLGNLLQAAELSRRCIADLPMREEGYTLAALCEQAGGSREKIEHYRKCLRALERLRLVPA